MSNSCKVSAIPLQYDIVAFLLFMDLTAHL